MIARRDSSSVVKPTDFRMTVGWIMTIRVRMSVWDRMIAKRVI